MIELLRNLILILTRVHIRNQRLDGHFLPTSEFVDYILSEMEALQELFRSPVTENYEPRMTMPQPNVSIYYH